MTSQGLSQYNEPWPGTIVSVEMINFMVHAHRKIELSPRINFINGRNGSGKSSILVALSVGLGGTPKGSSRGSKLSELIKYGESKASIIIVLHNSTKGYKYDIYGNTITIIRKLTKSSSTFKVKDCPLPATQTRDEVNRILDFFHIQVGNPCALMHQDVARSFLAEAPPKKKFSVFMQATLLADIEGLLDGVKDDIKKLKEQLALRIEEKKAIDEERDKQKRIMTIITESNQIADRIEELENELMWAYYKTAHDSEEAGANKIARLEGVLDGYKAKMARRKARLEEGIAKLNELKDERNKIMQKLNELSKKKTELRTKSKKIEHEYTQNKEKLNSTRSKLGFLEKEVSESERDYKRLVEERERNLEQMRKNREEKQAAAQATIEQLTAEIAADKNELAMCKDNHERYRAEAETKNQDIKIMQGRIEAQTRKISELQSICGEKGGSNSLANLIKRNIRRFEFPPIGPVTDYLKVHDQRWAVAAQNVVGNALDKWIVSSHADERVMRELTSNAKIGYIITDFHTRAYRIERVNSVDARPMIDYLAISENTIQGRDGSNVNTYDVVHNALVDLYNADKVYCFEDDRSAERTVFSDREKVTAILKTGVIFRMQRGVQVRQGAKTTRAKIGVNYAKRIEEARHMIDSEKERLRIANEEYRGIQAEYSRYKEASGRIASALAEKQKRLRRAQGELDNQEDENIVLDSRINQVKERAESKQRELNNTRESVDRFTEALEALKKQKNELRDELNKLSAQVEDNPQEDMQYEKLSREKSKHETTVSRTQDKIDECLHRIEIAKLEMERLVEKRQSCYEQAKKHSPYCEQKYATTARPIEAIVDIIKEESRKLEESKKCHNQDIDKVRSNYRRIKYQRKKAKTCINAFQSFLDKAINVYNRRENKYKELFNSTDRKVRISFVNVLNRRKYRGKLRIDHENETLDIEIRPAADNSFTNSTNLSGGEKSYSLVALLLAFWDVMESPFYCVDEFDVFMDEINRVTAIALLVESTRLQIGKQFIFITPLNIDHLRQDEDVHIFTVE